MGLDYVDLIYACWPPPQGVSAEEIVDSVNGLVQAGKARAWGFVNWAPELIKTVCQVARGTGASLPAAAQLPYFVGYTEAVEGESEQAALADCGAGVVTSFSLAGGALTGKYSGGAAGRLTTEPDDPRLREAMRTGERLAELAREHDTTAAALALAFALNGPGVASVLFGATSPEQVHQNAGALDVGSELLTAVRAIV